MLGPACISVDHPRFLSFVPAAPTEASILFDLVVGASSIYGGSWLEGVGRGATPRTRRCAGSPTSPACPPSAGGVFVSGGTAGNLSALIAARCALAARAPTARHDRTRGLIAGVGAAPTRRSPRRRGRWTPTSSRVPADERGRLHRDGAARRRVDGARRRPIGSGCSPSSPPPARPTPAWSTTSPAPPTSPPSSARGCTSTAPTAAPALAAPSVRGRFAGIERADSFIVDPHKWLFAPFDCCALLYRDPAIARAAHTQHAEYLDVLHGDDDRDAEWNAGDYAHHLSRRARGLPFWFSLATYGTDAYREAVETTLARHPRAAPS